MQGIASLMNSGFSLQQTLTILDDPASRPVFDEIRARLESGEAISDFLCEYTPAAYARYLSGFLMYMPFHNALALSLSIVDTDDRNQNELLKGLLYPVLMMVGIVFTGFLSTTGNISSIKLSNKLSPKILGNNIFYSSFNRSFIILSVIRHPCLLTIML